MVDKIVRQDTFADRTDDRVHCENVFNAHIAHVKATAPADRLIVYEVGSGWKPLCVAFNVARARRAVSQNQYHGGLSKTAERRSCPFRKSYPPTLMMQTAKLWMRFSEVTGPDGKDEPGQGAYASRP